MTRFGWMIALGCVLAIGGVALLVWGFTRHSDVLGTRVVERSSVVDPSALAIYSNGTYGFTFFYPATARIEDASSSQPWRVNANLPGTPIARVVLESGEVRIGASTDTRAVSSCAKPGPSESAEPQLAVAEVTWNVFSYDQLGTDNQKHVTSYRTVRDATCFAVEAFEPLDVASSTAPSDAAVVVRNFSFVR